MTTEMCRHQRQFPEVSIVLESVYCKSVQLCNTIRGEGTIDNKPNAVISFVVV